MKTRNFFKTLLLLVLLVVAGGNSVTAQDTVYHPFADHSVWSVNNIKYGTWGDTIICGRDYLKVYRQEEDHPFDFDVEQAEYFCAIRNDTAAQRVYGIYKAGVPVWSTFCIGHHDYLPSDTTSDTSEFLLFDFSIESGDTIEVASFERHNVYLYNISTYEGEYPDSVLLLNNTSRRVRRVIIPNAYYYPFSYSWVQCDFIEWIEGIGGPNGVFNIDIFAFFASSETTYPYLLCFEEEGDLMMSYTEWDDDHTYDCFYLPGVGTIENTKVQGVIYPNPTNGFLHIEFSGQEESLSKQVSIYSVTGQIIDSQILNSLDFEINIQNYPSGIYIIKVTDETGIVLQEKIIKR